MITKSMSLGYGIDEVVDIASKELSRKGFDVTVLTTFQDINPQGYDIELIQPLRLPGFSAYWQRHFLSDVRSILPFIAALKDFDVVITFDPMHLIGAVVKVRFHKPVVMYYFGNVPLDVLESFTRRGETLREKFLWQSSFHFADCLLVNSNYTRDLLSADARDRAIVNYHGVEHLICRNLDRAEAFRDQLGLKGKKVVLSVGRFSTPYKGMKDIARIFTNLRRIRSDVALLLVGKGSPQDVEWFSASEDMVVLRNVPYETLVLCFALCDVYCTASRWEGFDLPLVAAEANSKPVVAYDVGAHSEVMLNRQTGFLAKSPSEQLHFLELLVDNDDMRKALGKKAAAYARKFSWRGSMETMERIIRMLGHDPGAHTA